MILLDINISKVVWFTNELEKMHRSALPNAIREALNSAAFDVKMRTMPKSAANSFIQRQPNFFKANSRVEMARGWDIGSMKSVVGFTDEHLKNKSTNYAIQDLEQQEYGGQIDKKSFIPMDEARVSSSAVKPVRPINRLTEIKGIVKSALGGGKSRKAAFVRAAAKAGKGGFVLGNLGKQQLWRINSIATGSEGVNIGKTAIYSFSKGRSVHVGETGFMRWASLESANKLEDFYIVAAQKQIDRLVK